MDTDFLFQNWPILYYRNKWQILYIKKNKKVKIRDKLPVMKISTATILIILTRRSYRHWSSWTLQSTLYRHKGSSLDEANEHTCSADRRCAVHKDSSCKGKIIDEFSACLQLLFPIQENIFMNEIVSAFRPFRWFIWNMIANLNSCPRRFVWWELN